MINLQEIIQNAAFFAQKILESMHFIFATSTIAVMIKLTIFFMLISRTKKSCNQIKQITLLCLIIIGSISADIAWVLVSVKHIGIFNVSYKFYIFYTRISWALYMLYYQSLNLFLLELSEKNNKKNLLQKILLCINSGLFLIFVFIAFYNLNCEIPSMRPSIEIITMPYATFFITLILTPINIFFALKSIKKAGFPRILKRQIGIFIKFIIIPTIIADIIQVYPFKYFTTTIANSYSFIGLTTLLITYGIFHCIRKIMNIRFLNLDDHVQEKQSKKFHFVDDFKSVINNFTTATTENDLENLTKDFFFQAFSVPKNRINFHIKFLGRHSKSYESINVSEKSEELIIDNFINSYGPDTKVGKFLRKNKILITDEIEFSNFYEEKEEQEKVLQLLRKISADILIPLFDNNNITGYIIVEKHSRINKQNKNAPFYSSFERDQMIVYSNYICNMIKLFQTQNINQIILQEKQLKEEVYSLKQEVLQYRESLNYFIDIENHLKNPDQRIGLIIYKNKTFHFENKMAKEIIPVNLNIHNGHPTTKKIKAIAQQAHETKQTKSCIIKDKNGKKISIHAIPRAEKNSIIITVQYCQAQDLINNEILESSPEYQHKLESLLHLQTTNSGKIIEEFLPSSNPKLINSKIDLLTSALSSKTIFLNAAKKDALKALEIIQKISNRETIYTIDLPTKDISPNIFSSTQYKNKNNKSIDSINNPVLNSPDLSNHILNNQDLNNNVLNNPISGNNNQENYDLLIKLFGANPILMTNNLNDNNPILYQLNGTGILFISNIESLGLETQKYLYQFIKYGFFKIFRGEKKFFSNVMIVCHTEKDLTLYQNNNLNNQNSNLNNNLNNLLTNNINNNNMTLYPELFYELTKKQITIPTPKMFNETDIEKIIQDFSKDILKEEEFTSIFELTEAEIKRLANLNTESFTTLKDAISKIFNKKSKRNNLINTISSDNNQEDTLSNYNKSKDLVLTENIHSYGTSKATSLEKDLQIAEAVKLGKNALKDPKVMTLLWNTFKNQNKIANLLGVNRSSINRRCREYNLLD